MKKADFDLGDDGRLRPTKQTYRQKAVVNQRPDDDDEDLNDDGPVGVAARKVKALMRKEEAQLRKVEAEAGLKELELQIESGEYLPRDAYREATATALATLSQGLRSIPDTLERKHSIGPDLLQAIEVTIDDALAQVASTLSMFTESETK